MFNKEKQNIFNFCLEKLKPLGPYFPVSKLQETDIHPAIYQYVSASVDFLIYEDRNILIQNSAFDYTGLKVRSLFGQLAEELRKSKKFSLKFYLDSIKAAIEFNTNFLLSPRDELIKLIYTDKKQATAEEILLRLNHIHYYGYITSILSTFINRKKVILLNFEEFNKLMIKVDELSTETNKTDIIKKAIEAIGDFFNIGFSGAELIPSEAVRLFLKNREFLDFEEVLKANLPEGDDRLPRSFYFNLLNGEDSPAPKFNIISPEAFSEETADMDADLITEDTEPEFELSVKEEDNFIINPDIKEEPEESAEADTESEPEETEEATLEFVDEDGEEILLEEETEEEINEDKPVDSEDKVYTLDQKIEMLKNSSKELKEDTGADFSIDLEEYSSFLDEPAESDKQKTLDFAELLDNKKMTKIIEKVFDYDMEEFAETIEDVSRAANLSDAQERLNKVFLRNSIDPDSGEAKDFVNIIKEYFG